MSLQINNRNKSEDHNIMHAADDAMSRLPGRIISTRILFR